MGSISCGSGSCSKSCICSSICALTRSGKVIPKNIAVLIHDVAAVPSGSATLATIMLLRGVPPFGTITRLLITAVFGTPFMALTKSIPLTSSTDQFTTNGCWLPSMLSTGVSNRSQPTSNANKNRIAASIASTIPNCLPALSIASLVVTGYTTLFTLCSGTWFLVKYRANSYASKCSYFGYFWLFRQIFDRKVLGDAVKKCQEALFLTILGLFYAQP